MRMMTNMLSLMQMTRMTIAINELKNVLHTLWLFQIPSTGGLSASIVSTSDICIGEGGPNGGATMLLQEKNP